MRMGQNQKVSRLSYEQKQNKKYGWKQSSKNKSVR